MAYDIFFALSLVGNIFLLLSLRGSAGYVDALYRDITVLIVENHKLQTHLRLLAEIIKEDEKAKDYPDFADQPLN